MLLIVESNVSLRHTVEFAIHLPGCRVYERYNAIFNRGFQVFNDILLNVNWLGSFMESESYFLGYEDTIMMSL